MNPLLITDGNSPQVDVLTCGSGVAAYFSCRSPLKQTGNEDGLLIWGDAHQAVLAVADGVGGSRSGGAAAQLTLQVLSDALTAEPQEPLRTRIIDAIEDANRAVLKLGTGAATTLAVVTLEENRLRSFHIGDSTILLCGQRGRVKWQTVAHSPVGFAVEAGLLDEEDALHHDQRHVISNYVGSATMRIEIGPRLQLSPFDSLLLATDGIFDNLRQEEIIHCVRKGPVGATLTQLLQAVNQRMIAPEPQAPSKPDDFTAVLYRLQPRSHSSSVSPTSPAGSHAAD